MARTDLETAGGKEFVRIVTKSEALAERVIRTCRGLGVTEFVLCAGSRNSPLTLAVLGSEVRHWVFFEERSAAFFALGRARTLDRPVAVVTTSGTAATELYPAVVEALYQRLPLLCLTADRPKAFRGSGAPQSIEQAGLFCLYAVANWDVDDEAELDLSGWDGNGPAHLNLCFDEPLLEPGGGGSAGSDEVDGKVPRPERTGSSSKPRVIPVPDVILAGWLNEGEREEVQAFLREAGAPILAEAASGLREDPALRPWVVQGGERLPAGATVRHVLRIGGVPSCRLWRDLESQPEVSVYCAMHRGFRGLARRCEVLPDLSAVKFEGVPETGWLSADREKAEKLDGLLASMQESEPGWVRRLSEWMRPGSLVFVGNSLPVREWNLAASFNDRGLRVVANRGANGIDGAISTFLGLAADEDSSYAVVGDLTALYDLAAPWVKGQLRPGKRVIVVLNNGGGRIFGRLPVLKEVPEATRAVTETTHDLNLEGWAALWSMGYARSMEEVPDEGEGCWLLEIQPDEGQTAAFWEAWDALPG